MGSYLSIEDEEKPTEEILQAENSVETSTPHEEPSTKKKIIKNKNTAGKTKNSKKKQVKTKKRIVKFES